MYLGHTVTKIIAIYSRLFHNQVYPFLICVVTSFFFHTGNKQEMHYNIMKEEFVLNKMKKIVEIRKHLAEL